MDENADSRPSPPIPPTVVAQTNEPAETTTEAGCAPMGAHPVTMLKQEEAPIGEEEVPQPFKAVKRTTLADVESTEHTTKPTIFRTYDQAVAAPLSGNPHVYGYISSVYGGKALIHVHESPEIVIVRAEQFTLLEGTMDGINFATVPLSTTVRVYGVRSGSTNGTKGTKTPRLHQTKWRATRIQLVRTDFFRTRAVAITEPRLTSDTQVVKLITGHTPNGYRMRVDLIPVHDQRRMISENNAGQFYMVDAVRMPPFFHQTDDAEGVAVTFNADEKEAFERRNQNDDRQPPREWTLADPRPTTEHEIEMIANKCKDVPITRFETHQRYVGSAATAVAAYVDRAQSRHITEQTVERTIQIKTRREQLTTTISVPRSFVEDADPLIDSWITGKTVTARFPVGEKRFTTMATVKEITVSGTEAMVRLQFSQSATRFIKAWTREHGKSSVTIGPDPEQSLDATQAIKREFKTTTVQSEIYQQYIGRKTAQKKQQLVTKEQRQLGSITLDEAQTDALRSSLAQQGISVTIAPPGSGKTALASTIVITGPTNQAISSALAPLEAVIPAEKRRMCRYASKHIADEDTDDQRFFIENMARQFEEFITDPIQQKSLTTTRNALAVAETELDEATTALEILEKQEKTKQVRQELVAEFEMLWNPNIIATTATLLLRYRERRSCRYATHIIIDEASRLHPPHLLAMIASFQHLRKITLIGDSEQLAPFYPAPDASDIKKYAGEADLVRLKNAYPKAVVHLEKIYRAHPLITRNVLANCYPYRVEPGVTEEERPMARRAGLPMAADGTPVILYHTNGVSEGGVNEEEAELIYWLVQHLRSRGADRDDILVVTYHTNQRDHLRRILQNIAVETIDGSQGRQAPIVILATTKRATSTASIQRSLRFVGDPKRSIAAVSRAMHAFYVFGDVEQLGQLAFFSRIVEWARSNGAVRTPTPKNGQRATLPKRQRTGDDPEPSGRCNQKVSRRRV
ncbi:unnamed protein product [Caenorhabditis bovis]|uniref:DNA2/NAM7 helicase-like C-terminal domain-containing protein n=1 Tax=Caenorhabditis bovis TaxID=2654633 RepID=A0A8S1F8F5_9PELO|nr:unnamed protein product [Caenorhabditis bovis]